MASKGIWYVKFPTYQYNEDVQALAKEADLRILNANFDEGDGADEVPELTLKSGEADEVELFDVFKLDADGVRAERASKHNLNEADAINYVDTHPDDKYEIVKDGE